MPLVLGAALADIFVVGALLLFAWAVVWVFQKPLVALFSQVPVVGANIVRAVIDVTASVARTAEDWARKAAEPLTQLIQVPIKALGDWIAMQTGAFEDLAAHFIAWVGSTADSLASLANRVTTALGRIASLADLVDAVRTGLANLAARVAYILSTAIPDAIAAVRAWAAARIAAVTNALEVELRKVIAAVAAGVAPAIAAALRPVTAAIDAIRPWVLQAVAAAVHPVQIQLDQLGQVFGRAIDGIRAELGNLARLLPLAALLPLVGTIVQAVPRWLTKERDCWDPACDFLGPVTDGLGEVGQLLTGSALLALVAAAIADPEGTADTVAGFKDELRPLASLVTEALAGRPI